MENEKFEDQSFKSKDERFTNNDSTIINEEQSTVAEDREKDILEDSEEENYAEQTESLKAEEKEEEPADEVDLLKGELEESKDKYLRLYSEFENFRRRTAKERLELIKTANEDLILGLLPVLDDFDRAYKAIGDQEETKAVKDGVQLIYSKFSKTLESKGLKAMGDLKGEAFDAEVHDAITQIPVEEEKLKGKIVDVIEKGYYLNDKVIRYAKVVIGA